MRKYPKTTDYWVYVHRTPDNMYYVGMSKTQICQRWKPSLYSTMSLHPYINQYGWDNIEHLVVKDGLTKQQALYWEERLIQMYTEMGCCINNNRSGNCTVDMKVYKQQYNQRPEVKEHNRQYDQRPERKSYKRQYNQQYYHQPEWKVYNRVSYYNQKHTPIETPMEAKKKYLESGYIPTYIKSNDLI